MWASRVLDSGIVNHDQIPVSAFYDFFRSGVKTKQFDNYGHGTHIAGMIRNKDDKSDARYRSVAGGARLIGMRVLDDSGTGYSSTVIKAIEFAIANKAALKIDVINLSLGHPIYEPAASDPLVQAVERAVAAGIVVVVAAGERGHQPRDRRGGLCRDHVPRQCAVRHFGRRTRYEKYAHAPRR
jgi:serine protease AprX